MLWGTKREFWLYRGVQKRAAAPLVSDRETEVELKRDNFCD